MRTFSEYNRELISLEKSVADGKKSIQSDKERQFWLLEDKYSKYLGNSFIIGEEEQAKYRELMEDGLKKKKQQLTMQEKAAMEIQDGKMDDFKNINGGYEYRVYRILKGIIDDEKNEGEKCESDIARIPNIIEQLKRVLKLKKLEQEVVKQRKKVLASLNIEFGDLKQVILNHKHEIQGTLEEIIDDEKANSLYQRDIHLIQKDIACLEWVISWLERQLRWRKSDYKQIKKELDWIVSENPENEKEMWEALKYAEIWMLIRKISEPIQNLMEQSGIWKEFIGALRRYLRKEWKLSRGKALLSWEENAELQIFQKHINQWEKKYWIDFVKKLVQILREEWMDVIQERPTEEMENDEGLDDSSSNNSLVSSEEVKNKNIIKMLENSNSISDSISILKYLWFIFENEETFINQVKEAENEWLVWVVENINRWIIKFIIGSWTIDHKKTSLWMNWYRIALNCNGRNPRILLKIDRNFKYKIVCIAPHEDYENILLWQTKNCFQLWKWNWMKRGESWWKKWRA